jgi:redox-sensitive bicupin YhaK (pirin superfamily)
MTSPQFLTAHTKDLGGGFTVRRLLPAARQRSVGPFIFFDHFGPVTEQPTDNHDVRPHPHIGLATVTYLFDGAMMHRDSLGTVQQIEPGAINWMTAGKGIAHSERRPDAMKAAPYINHGLQLWAALPRDFEETEPAFAHTPAHAIPQVEADGATVRVLIGQALGHTSPVATFAPTLYLDVRLAPEGRLQLPPLAQEMAVYLVQGALRLNAEAVPTHGMAVVAEGAGLDLAATGPEGARLVVIGGDALDGPRHMWWNFVSSRKERIVQAAADWEAGRFTPVPGETEFIPLPVHRFMP